MYTNAVKRGYFVQETFLYISFDCIKSTLYSTQYFQVYDYIMSLPTVCAQYDARRYKGFMWELLSILMGIVSN